MNEVVKHLIKTLDMTRRRNNTFGKRELVLTAGGMLVGVAVGALSTALAASRSRRIAERKAANEAA